MPRQVTDRTRSPSTGWSAVVFLSACLAPGCLGAEEGPEDHVFAAVVRADGVETVLYVNHVPAGAAAFARWGEAGTLHVQVADGAGNTLVEGYRSTHLIEIHDAPDPRDSEDVELESTVEFFTVPGPLAEGTTARFTFRDATGEEHVSEHALHDVVSRADPLGEDVGRTRAPLDDSACEPVMEVAADCSSCEAPDHICMDDRCIVDRCPPDGDWDARLEPIGGSGSRKIVLIPVGGWSNPETFVSYATRQVENLFQSNWFAAHEGDLAFYAFTAFCDDDNPVDHEYGNDIAICTLGRHPAFADAYRVASLHADRGCGGVTQLGLTVVGMGGMCDPAPAENYVLAHELGHSIGHLEDEYRKGGGWKTCDTDASLAYFADRPNVHPGPAVDWWCDHGGETCPAGEPVMGYPGPSACTNHYMPCMSTIMRHYNDEPDFGPVGVAAMDHGFANDSPLQFSCTCTPTEGDSDTCGNNGCGGFYSTCEHPETCRIEGASLTGPGISFECREACPGASCFSSLALEVCEGDTYLEWSPTCGGTGISIQTCAAGSTETEVECLEACDGGARRCSGSPLCPGESECVYDDDCGGWRVATCPSAGAELEHDGTCHGSELSCGGAVCGERGEMYHGCADGMAGRCAPPDVDGCLLCPTTYPGCDCAHATRSDCDADPGCSWHNCGQGGAGQCAPSDADGCIICPGHYPGC
ncbi:MAG TPA: hypothetical protein RMH99_04645 [Sandaracinaceae bacterium LLY-WYZ-13_1]|nr:hypothetical protein [Sandaracinaceae bacterium LLY-WYZ-13_1]